ncbi:MAG TPA: carboxypeptidase regulatory-like domain-containing protein [Terriglobales bacterium]|nr:carboxypeptidase regulatory-like domain-containing protein [Terriglobales bacterium]
MRRHLILAILLTAHAVWAATWLSQLGGRCVGEDGKPLANAVLKFQDPGTGHHFQVTTNENGSYFHIGVESGVYNVRVTQAGKEVGEFHQLQITWSNSLITINFDIAHDSIEVKRDRLHQEVVLGSTPLPEYLLPEHNKEDEKIAAINAKLAEAKALGAQGNWLAAAEVLGVAVDIDPKRDLPWAHLGEAYRQAAASGVSQAEPLLEKSIHAYQHAISLHPHVAYYNNLGQAYAQLKRWNDAAREFGRAAELSPGGNAIADMNAGNVLLAKSENESGETAQTSLRQAAEALGRVNALEPQNSEAYYLRGICLLRLTEVGSSDPGYTQVKEAFLRYMELDGKGPHAEEVKAMLESLGGLGKRE